MTDDPTGESLSSEADVQNIVCDCPGLERSHGYTVTVDSHRWLWVYDHDDESLSFRKGGLPTDHPYKRTGRVPQQVRATTKRWIDSGGIARHS